MKKKQVVWGLIIIIYLIIQVSYLIYVYIASKPKPVAPAIGARIDARNTSGSDSDGNSNTDTSAGEDTSDETATGDDVNDDEKPVVIYQGALQLTQRKASTLEATLASRVPLAERVVQFTTDKKLKNIDISQYKKVVVDNQTYEFKLSAYKGKYLNSSDTAFLLQLQIPKKGSCVPVFKWFVFDTNLQLVSKLNLRDKGLNLPAKITKIYDYDGDNIDEIILETIKYSGAENYSTPKYMFKVNNGKQIRLIWHEDSTDKNNDTGKCASVKKIVFDDKNPPPKNDPNLISIKKIYSSVLSAGTLDDSSTNTYTRNPNISVITNSVTYTEIKDYPDRQSKFAKSLDVYTYEWDTNKQEFVYLKKESSNLELDAE